MDVQLGLQIKEHIVGRKKKYASEAEKQKAYRERLKMSFDNVTLIKETAAALTPKRVTKSSYGSSTKKCSCCGVQNYYRICRRVKNPMQWHDIHSASWFPRINRLSKLIENGRLMPIEWVRFAGQCCDFCKEFR